VRAGAATVLDHAAWNIGYQCDVTLSEPHRQSVQAFSRAHSRGLPPSAGQVGESGGTGDGLRARKSTGPGRLSARAGVAGRKTPYKWRRRARRL
jgi:hypothetical protein